MRGGTSPLPGYRPHSRGPGRRDHASTVVPIPFDCVDGFTEAFYGRPEAFLDPEVRRSQSAWGFVDREAEDRFVAKLRADLESGKWDRSHGALRTQSDFIGALRLIVAFTE